MKTIRFNGLKPEIIDLNYKIINEEKEKYEKKGKTDKVESYNKLLNALNENSTPEEIEKEVNSIIDADREEIKELKSRIKNLEKEVFVLTHLSERENDDAATMIIMMNSI